MLWPHAQHFYLSQLPPAMLRIIFSLRCADSVRIVPLGILKLPANQVCEYAVIAFDSEEKRRFFFNTSRAVATEV